MSEVSIIIPAYNCSKTIEKTVQSLLCQTYSDFELLIIDDGSTDNTAEILYDLAHNDHRIKTLTVKNGGPAKARNIGLKKSIGKYIYFLDSDDEVESAMLLKMVSLIKEKSLDMVCTGYFMQTLSDTEEIKSSQVFSFKDMALTSHNEIARYILPLCDKHLMYVVWNKLYKKEFLQKNNITFQNYMGGEDRLFNLNCIEKLSSLGVIEAPLYHYYIRSGNSLAGRYVKNRFEASLLCMKAMDKIISDFKITDESQLEMADFAAIKQVVASLTQLYSKTCSLSKKEKNAEILKIVKTDKVVKVALSKTSSFNYAKIAKLIIKSQNLFLIKSFIKSIVIFQTKFSSIFLKIKHSNK